MAKWKLSIRETYFVFRTEVVEAENGEVARTKLYQRDMPSLLDERTQERISCDTLEAEEVEVYIEDPFTKIDELLVKSGRVEDKEVPHGRGCFAPYRIRHESWNIPYDGLSKEEKALVELVKASVAPRTTTEKWAMIPSQLRSRCLTCKHQLTRRILDVTVEEQAHHGRSWTRSFELPSGMITEAPDSKLIFVRGERE